MPEAAEIGQLGPGWRTESGERSGRLRPLVYRIPVGRCPYSLGSWFPAT